MVAATAGVDRAYKGLSTAILQAQTPAQESAALHQVMDSMNGFVNVLKAHTWPANAQGDVSKAIADLGATERDLTALTASPHMSVYTFLNDSQSAHADLNRVRAELGLPSLPSM